MQSVRIEIIPDREGPTEGRAGPEPVATTFGDIADAIAFLEVHAGGKKYEEDMAAADAEVRRAAEALRAAQERRAKLGALPAPTPGTAAEVTAEHEPAAVRKTGALPEDFPGKTALDEAGYGTYAKVRALVDKGELTSVPGIGDATASKIVAAL